MKESLVSEPIQPVFSAVQGGVQAAGEPVLPAKFVWRGEERTIAEVIERWKELSRPGAAMQERYVRKHWYRIRTEAGEEMKIYFERQARSKGGAKQRWWIFSVLGPE